MRHPEFSIFAVRLGRAFGGVENAISAMEKAELDKSLLHLQDKNGLPIQILRVLVSKNGVWKFTSSEMAEEIIKNMEAAGEKDDKTAGFVNARKVGKVGGLKSPIKNLQQHGGAKNEKNCTERTDGESSSANILEAARIKEEGGPATPATQRALLWSRGPV